MAKNSGDDIKELALARSQDSVVFELLPRGQFARHNRGMYPRVQIINREHPHFEEYGRFTGEIILPVWGGKMALVKLEHCRHGGDACYVSPGDIREVAERNDDEDR